MTILQVHNIHLRCSQTSMTDSPARQSPAKPPARKPPHATRVIVGLSGGVDSAVAALLLREQGYDVHAVFMKNWDEDDTDNFCPAAQDLADAEDVSRALDIPFRTVSFSAEYWDRVFRYFLDEYASGRTPNPDILCNREIKFRAFLDYAHQLGADFIATGHYARILQDDDGMHLLKGIDPGKDQTYFLYALEQWQLAGSLFPLGLMLKKQVRRLAARAGLANHSKKDSTGICFIGERKFSDFLSRYLPARPGEIRTLDNQTIGTHQGLVFYTIGQRRGLGIGGLKNASSEAWYVVSKDLNENTLLVAQGHHHPRLYHHGLRISRVHWISGMPPPMPLRCDARIRHQMRVQACTVHSSGKDECEVRFSQPQWAISPGQSVVFYQGDECLGGGVIDTPLP